VITGSYTDNRSVRYRVLVALLIAIATTACASRAGTTPRPRPFPGATLPPVAGDPAAGIGPADASVLVRTALGFLGTPYRNGGSDPSGFDCSGFVQYVFSHHGVVLPREVRDQYRAGREINVKDVQPGDLIFFETVSSGASHVGMIVSEGRFVHAPSSRGVVRIEAYVANYWSQRIVGARRVSETVALR
jgi:cell wall-associated NlpC family hydrolase